MKSLRILLVFLLMACLCTACTITVYDDVPVTGETSADTSPANASPLPGGDAPDAGQPPAATAEQGHGEPYTQHDFYVMERSYDLDLGLVPEDEFLLIVNDVFQNSGVFSSETDAVLPFSITFVIDEPFTASVRFLVMHDGETYEYTDVVEFSETGSNTVQLLTKTSGLLVGSYMLEWYIDGYLAYQGSTMKP